MKPSNQRNYRPKHRPKELKVKHHRFELQYINLLATLRQYIEDEHHISQDLGDNCWTGYSGWHEGEMIGTAYKQALLAYDEAQACFMDAKELEARKNTKILRIEADATGCAIYFDNPKYDL